MIGPEAPPEPMPELYQELARLPERYRAPLVLCYLEGQTHDQAARELGCGLRTLQTRLLRAKGRLRTSLARRGLAPAVGLLANGSGNHAATASAGTTRLPSVLIGSTASAAVQYAAARHAEMSPAVLSLARATLRIRFPLRIRQTVGLATVFAAVLATVFAAAPTAVLAPGNSPDEPAKMVSGRVLDTHGRPIAGASVWMPVRFDESDRSSARATTDAEGRYSFPVPELWAKTPQHRRLWAVWAHAVGHQIATAGAYDPLSGKSVPVDLTLGPPTDTSFLVIEPNGAPVAGVVVEPLHFKTQMAYNIPPRTMIPVLQGVSDQFGRAVLPALPRDGLAAVQVTSQTQGIQQLRINDADTEPAQRTIRLRPVGRAFGRIVSDRPGWTKGLTVYVTTHASPDGTIAWPSTEGFAKVVTRDDGTFVIRAIATGGLQILTDVDPSLPVRPRLPEQLEIRAGELTRVVISLELAVEVHGVIRVKDTGEPVAGASIHVAYGSRMQGDTVVSDANGRYTTRVLPGDVRMQVIMMPDRFVQLGVPWNEPHHVPGEPKEFELPSIDVVRGIKINGRLVDQDARPVANVELRGSSPQRTYAFARTDANGEFTTNSVPPDMQLEYSVIVRRHEPPVPSEIVTHEPLLLRTRVQAEAGAGPRPR